MKLLCKLGLHKIGTLCQPFNINGVAFVKKTKMCKRCGKVFNETIQ